MLSIVIICVSITIVEFTNGRPGIVYSMEVSSGARSELPTYVENDIDIRNDNGKTVIGGNIHRLGAGLDGDLSGSHDASLSRSNDNRKTVISHGKRCEVGQKNIMCTKISVILIWVTCSAGLPKCIYC